MNFQMDKKDFEEILDNMRAGDFDQEICDYKHKFIKSWLDNTVEKKGSHSLGDLATAIEKAEYTNSELKVALFFSECFIRTLRENPGQLNAVAGIAEDLNLPVIGTFGLFGFFDEE